LLAVSQAAKKSKKPSFRGAFFAEESLFSWGSIEEGFLTESIPIPIGIRNDDKMDFFPSLFSRYRQANSISIPELPDAVYPSRAGVSSGGM